MNNVDQKRAKTLKTPHLVWGGIALLLSFVLVICTRMARKPGSVSIIGKWHVDAGDQGHVREHTYEFSNLGVCIEKRLYQTPSGNIDTLPAFVTRREEVTHSYKFLGGSRYQLRRIKSVLDGEVVKRGAPTQTLDIALYGNDIGVGRLTLSRQMALVRHLSHVGGKSSVTGTSMKWTRIH